MAYGKLFFLSRGKNKDKIKLAIDLAKLSKGLLKGEDLTAFVKRSVESLA